MYTFRIREQLVMTLYCLARVILCGTKALQRVPPRSASATRCLTPRSQNCPKCFPSSYRSTCVRLKHVTCPRVSRVRSHSKLLLSSPSTFYVFGKDTTTIKKCGPLRYSFRGCRTVKNHHLQDNEAQNEPTICATQRRLYLLVGDLLFRLWTTLLCFQRCTLYFSVYTQVS